MLFLKGNGKLSLWELKNVGADDGSQVMKLVKILLDELQRKREPVTRVLFPDHFYLSDDDLYYVVQRVPKILELYMPNTTNRITAVGFSRAIQNLRELTSLTVGPINFRLYRYHTRDRKSLQESSIFENVWNGCELNVKDGNTFVLDKYTSLFIAQNLGKVKKLHFGGCLIHKAGLKNLFSKCKYLEYVLIMRCKHPIGNPMKRRPGSYFITKRILEDNTMQWYTTGAPDCFYNSISSLLDDVWRSNKLMIKMEGELKQSIGDSRQLQ
ncbi:hypothetical protein FRX31_017490 [Thalictrum thalictroides]|uniref:Uncharacterized protein n=1 Tax=Thalictrum thalictroides TaxID=46969 RepID=A0A7J6W9L7_THATH|nr:hypothetical protein FRX31_017490 [Thalictrum thalictroides]